MPENRSSISSQLQRRDAFVAEMKDDEKKARAQGQSWHFDVDGLLRHKGQGP